MSGERNGSFYVDAARWALTVIAGLSVVLVGVFVIVGVPGWSVAVAAGTLYGTNGVLWGSWFVVLLRVIRRGAEEGDGEAAWCAAEFDNAVLSDRGMAVAVFLTWPVAMVRSGLLP